MNQRNLCNRIRKLHRNDLIVTKITGKDESVIIWRFEAREMSPSGTLTWLLTLCGYANAYFPMRRKIFYL